MYFVLKILKIFIYIIPLYMLSDTLVSTIRSFSAAHAVSGPVWCLVRCVLCSYNTAGLEDTTNQAPQGIRDCMCS